MNAIIQSKAQGKESGQASLTRKGKTEMAKKRPAAPESVFAHGHGLGSGPATSSLIHFSQLPLPAHAPGKGQPGLRAYAGVQSPRQPRPGLTRTIKADENPKTETAHKSPISRTCAACDEKEKRSLVAGKTLTTETQALGPVAPPTTTNHCSPTKADFTSIPSGVLPASFSGSKFGAPFSMKAAFDAKIPCTCACGEYRQYVRGYFKSNGTTVAHRLCGNTLDPATYYEDCATIGGTDYKYGYRSIKFGTSYFDNPDQQGGCNFNGSDHPGLSGYASGDKLEVNLDFVGKLVDTCDGNKELKSASWSVVGTGTAP